MAKHTGQTSRATCLETRQEVGDPAISFHTVRFVIFFKVNNMGRYRERIDRDTGVGSSPLFPSREQASGQHCPYFPYTIVACRVLKSRKQPTSHVLWAALAITINQILGETPPYVITMA